MSEPRKEVHEEHPIQRFQEMARAVGEGSLPTSEQATRMMEELKSSVHQATREVDLSASGQKLLYKAEHAIETTERVMKERNADDLLQELIYHARLAADCLQEPVSETVEEMKVRAESGYKHLSEESKRLMDNLVNPLKLFAQSVHFRRQVAELSQVLSELLSVYGHKIKEAGQELTEKVEESAENVEEASKEGSAQEVHEKAFDETKEVRKEAETQIQQLSAETKAMNISEEIDSSKVFERLKLALKEVVNNPEWHSTVDHLIDLSKYAYHVGKEATEPLKEALSSEQEESEKIRKGRKHLAKAKEAALKLLERLAGGYSLQNLINEIKQVAEVIGKQPELKEFTDKTFAFVSDATKTEELYDGDNFEKRLTELRETGSEAFNDEFLGSLARVFSEMNSYSRAISADRLLNQFGSDWSSLMVSLFLDQDGRPTFKPELIFDSFKLLQFATEKMKAIPVDTLSGSDENADFVLDNVYISTEDIAPKSFHSMLTTTLDLETDKYAKHLARITLGRIKSAAKNLKFWYHKKTMPKMSDSGTADIVINEMEVVITLVPTPVEEASMFKDVVVNCKILNLDLKIHESSHQVLYTLLFPWVKGYVREALEKQVQDSIADVLARLNLQLVELLNNSRSTYEMLYGTKMQKKALPEWGSKSFDVGR